MGMGGVLCNALRPKSKLAAFFLSDFPYLLTDFPNILTDFPKLLTEFTKFLTAYPNFLTGFPNLLTNVPDILCIKVGCLTDFPDSSFPNIL